LFVIRFYFLLVDSAIGGSGEEKIGGNCPPPHSNPSIDFEFGKISLTRQANSPPRANRRFEFQKRRQLFIRMHNETLSVAAMCVSNPDRSPVRINR
jgi:hypothetical protein